MHHDLNDDLFKSKVAEDHIGEADDIVRGVLNHQVRELLQYYLRELFSLVVDVIER